MLDEAVSMTEKFDINIINMSIQLDALDRADKEGGLGMMQGLIIYFVFMKIATTPPTL